MKYWPMSIISQSSQMPWSLALEFYNVEVRHFDVLSVPAINAAGRVANMTPPREMPNLEVVQNVNGNPRRVFRDYPDWEEWSTLERSGVMLAPDGMLYVVIDGLH